jgi:hypothetical protein
VAVEVDTGGSPAAVGSTPGWPRLAEELAGCDTAAVAGKLGEDVEEDAVAPGLSAGEHLRLEWEVVTFPEVAQNKGRRLD